MVKELPRRWRREGIREHVDVGRKAMYAVGERTTRRAELEQRGIVCESAGNS
jgi:hypothetical protein